MKKKRKYILPIINIIIPILFFIIILFTKLSDNTMYFMVLSIIIGWAIPYVVLIITGLSMFQNKRPKLSLVFNVVNIFLNIMLIYFIVRMYDKHFFVFLIEYIIMLIISIVDSIYFIVNIKNHPSKENESIKKIKDENNGAIL